MESDAAQLGQGPAELAPQVGSQLRAGGQGLLLGLGGGPAQPKDLGTVHAASPMGAADSAPAAPPLHRLGPFLGEVQLPESLEHAHELAVEHPGRGGIELTGDGRHPRLVDQVETMTDLARQDHRMRLGHPTDGSGRRVADRPHLDGTSGPSEGAV